MYLKEKQFTIIKVYLAYMYVFFIEFMHKQKIILVLLHDNYQEFFNGYFKYLYTTDLKILILVG